MTDSDPKLPDDAAAGAAPPPPPPPDAPGGADAAAAAEPTAQMPTTDLPASAGGAMPPDGPDGTGVDGEEDVPWYKTPLGIGAIVVLVLAILGLIAWLIWGGDDEEDGASATSSALVLQVRELNGDPLDVGFVVNVQGSAGAETAYDWIRPEGVRGQEAIGNTGSSGRVVFEWTPNDTVTDPEAWTSTASGIVNVPAGWTPPGPIVDCVLDPIEGQESTVSMNIELTAADETIDRTAGFSLPNFTFSLGDTVRCVLDAGAPAPTTSSTVPESTVPATTAPATTAPATTAPATTAPATTAPATTAPATTPPTTPPTPPATAFEALEQAGDYTTFLSLVLQVDAARDLLEDPDATITVFAPTDDALTGVTPPADPDELEALLLSHIVDGEALDAAAMTDGRTEVDVATGGQQPVDGAASPPTVGGVDLVVDQLDIESGNGFSHGLAGVMPVAAP